MEDDDCQQLSLDALTIHPKDSAPSRPSLSHPIFATTKGKKKKIVVKAYRQKPAPSAETSGKNAHTLEKVSYILGNTGSERKRCNAIKKLLAMDPQTEGLSQYHEAQRALFLGFHAEGNEDEDPINKALWKIHYLKKSIEYGNRGIVACQIKDDQERLELAQPYFDLMYSARRNITAICRENGLEDAEIEMLCPPYGTTQDYDDCDDEDEDLSSEDEACDIDENEPEGAGFGELEMQLD